MNLRLAGKVAVVTGASKGIGLDGVDLGLGSELGEILGEVSGSGDRARTLADQCPGPPRLGRSGHPGGPARLIDEVVVAYGGQDVPVNNVGADGPRPGGFLSLTEGRLAVGTDHQLPGRHPHHPRVLRTGLRALVVDLDSVCL